MITKKNEKELKFLKRVNNWTVPNIRQVDETKGGSE